MKLIVGLGNPGNKYVDTRHNAGFMAIDHLQKHYNFNSFKTFDKGKSIMTKGEISGEKVILLKPQDFMNLSGIPTQAVANYFKIDRRDVIAIYDDVVIEYGSMRIREGGSAAGHNGVKSLIKHLNGDDFVRIRLGIKSGTPFPGALEDYVLGKSDSTEQESLNNTIQKVPEAIEILISENIRVAMNKYN